MKNRVKELIINLCALFFVLALFVLSIIFVTEKFNYKLSSAIGFSILGLIVNYILSLLFHEIGHVIFAKIKKLKVRFLNLGILSIDFGDKKIHPLTFFGKNAGESAFIPDDNTTASDFAFVSLGGLLFSVIYCAVCLIIAFSVNNPLCYCLLLAGCSAPLYILIVNLMPFDKTSDGAVLFNRDYVESFIMGNQLFDQIYQGKIPEKPENLEKNDQPLCLYYKFLFCAYEKNEQACREIIERLKMQLNSLTDDEYDLIFPEIVYFQALNGKIPSSIVSQAENYFNYKGEKICHLRSHYAFRKAMGDENWANTINLSYQKMLKESPTFIIAVEEFLFSLSNEEKAEN